MTLAKIIAHVGSFDSKSRSGGGLPLTTEESPFPAWINSSSDVLIELQSWGSFVTLEIQVTNHRSPRDVKSTKGPEIPIDVITNGVKINPTTFPSWNPPIDSPTAVARSWFGNHLIGKGRSGSAIAIDMILNMPICKEMLPWEEVIHRRQSNPFG